ncbi:MAG: phosphate ABC transporter permease subunit PstC [Mogibacterium sp.]|nr:phosphate ABC transporter permease subunit PstC [Mogibacterium sp.]
MKRKRDTVFIILVVLFTIVTVLTLVFVIGFITIESVPALREVGIKDFLFGQTWMPVEYTGTTSFGIGNFIAGTVFVSILAMFMASVISIGAATWLACVAGERSRKLIYPFVELLAGVPSVVYGFIGLTTLVRLFIRWGVHTGSCCLAAGIMLAIMLFPFLVSSCSDTILKIKNRYLPSAEMLGISKWYAITNMILPASFPGILTSMVLAIGRAMGETMAVMMVMGNANLFPSLLGKGETIASAIALEMGTALVGSTHYHALYASGLALVILLLIINLGIHFLRNSFERKGLL